ncbi:MAG: peptidase M15 [Bacteroidales bacterium]|nr:peptidase M15 [Bacteroidales bacterium]
MGNYFTIDELCYSDTAKAKGIDNTPSAQVQSNLVKLINNTLNPIREKYGKPIRVSSGYRSDALNKAVGGVSNSQHLTGQAADLVATNGGSLADIFKAAIACNNFDQLIWEGPKNSSTKWVHVSYADNPRREILYYNGNGYTNIASNWKNYVK